MKTTNKLVFILYYAGDFCAEFKSLDKAIKQAVTAYENNPEMIDRTQYYYIKLKDRTVVTVCGVDGKIVIE